MKLKLTSALLGAAFLTACASQGFKRGDLDPKLEERIQRSLEKRRQLVSGNPAYLSMVGELEKGKSQLNNGEYREAFLSFDKILKNERYTNYPEYSYAKYYLAAALYRLGVKYGALLYYVDIVQKEPLKPHTHESLRRAIEIAQELKDDELILYLASTITPDKVPMTLREEFRYYIAKDLYQKRDYDKASKLLNSIPHNNQLYLGAQYLLGAIATLKKDFRQAIEHFRTVSDTRSPIDYYENTKIRELASLALGRILYEQKSYPLSIVYYKKVDREGDYFPVAMYESAWGLFKLHKFNESLSVLHSLNSPFFEQIYFLKSYLLRGAIFLELCLYQDAVETLTGLKREFAGLGSQIVNFAKQAQSPREYYPLLSSKIRQQDGSMAYAYKPLFNLAAANRDFLDVHRYIRGLTGERKTLNSLQSPRADLIARLLEQKSSDLVEKASYLAGQKLRITRQVIEEFNELQDILQYEIISSERKILQTRSLRLAPPVLTGAELIKPEFTDSLKQSLIWWEYDGEYWEDEVGYYLYNLQNRCKEPQSQGEKR